MVEITEETAQSKIPTTSHVLRSSHESGMNSSIFRFKNINYVVKSKGEDKAILDNVSGTVKWGHVLAIMGPSGAGKVRYMKCLSYYFYSITIIFSNQCDEMTFTFFRRF
jgi:ABC-type glutathione transport system ATPase component